MPSETFYCPHCKSQLTKNAQHYIMGETPNAYFISFDQIPANVVCPACSGKIDTAKMIKGIYDQRDSILNFNSGNSFINGIMLLTFLGSCIVCIWILQVELDWMFFFAWFVGILCAYIIAITVGSILFFLWRLLTGKRNGVETKK